MFRMSFEAVPNTPPAPLPEQRPELGNPMSGSSAEGEQIQPPQIRPESEEEFYVETEGGYELPPEAADLVKNIFQKAQDARNNGIDPTLVS